jgi:GntR family transcriptional regulator
MSFSTSLERGPDAAPLYRQLTRRLLELAQSMPPGTRFPTDRELIDEFGVSRITVNQAVKSLVDSGYLRRMQGKGTFVTRPVFERNELTLNSFSEDTIAMGYKPGARLITHRVMEPEEKVARKLQLAPREKVLYLERLMSADDEVIAVLYTSLPLKLCKNFDEWFTAEALNEVSLYAVLEKKCGYNLAAAKETVRAIDADDREANLLGIPQGSALLWLRRLTYLDDQQPIEYSHLVYRGDRYRMELTTRRR